MKLATVILAAALVGCASPEYVARQSNWDVCRLSMGGPHSRAAEAEAASRGLDCRPYYGAIQGQLQRESEAVQQYQRALNPQPAVTCQSTPWGLGTRTTCN